MGQYLYFHTTKRQGWYNAGNLMLKLELGYRANV